jgi:hypothetical protein
MKNYTSLVPSPGTSPTTNYIRFQNDGKGGNGGNGDRGGGGLGGLADNLGLQRLEKHDERIRRENIGNSGNNISIIPPYDDNGDIVINDVVYRTTLVPFYYCIIDLVIINDIYVDIIDNSSDETKKTILASGKIRKYRVNGSKTDYNVYVEFANENVYHVNKRGIVMRMKVSQDMRKLIINTMVNFVGDGNKGGESANSGVVESGRAGGGGSGGGGRTGAKGGWFGCLSCFKAHNHQ